MGGSCYDRDVISTSSNRMFSDISSKAISSSYADSDLLPRKGKNSPCRDIDCFHRNPIVCVLDVTGSMGDWSKIIYDKLPLFFGEIEKQGYLTDAAISFAAVGDANTDSAPFQICNFSQSRELDDYLSRIWLEGGGGGQNRESYELMAYYYLHHCTLTKSELAFMFISGDEGFYPHIEPKLVAQFFGDDVSRMDSKKVFQQLRSKFNIFMLHKKYDYDSSDPEIIKQWRDVLGERVLRLDEAKAVIDVMLGAIALTSGTRNLNGYLKDMKDRGQTTQRLKDVEKSLAGYSDSLAIVKASVTGMLPVPAADAPRRGWKWRKEK
jgi:hypothetical protein